MNTNTQYGDQEDSAQVMELRSICKRLSERGVTRAECDYDGSGDEGFIDQVTCFPEGVTVEDDITNRLSDAIYSFLPGGWEIDDGAFGTLTIDVNQERLTIQYNERFTDYSTTTEEVAFGEEVPQ